MVIKIFLSEIWKQTINLLEQSIVIPVIAGALLSVITADIVRNSKKPYFFREIDDNFIADFLDETLLYVGSFFMAVVVLTTIYFIIGLGVWIFKIFN